MRIKIALLSLLLALPAQAGDTSGYERQPPARASSTTYTPANASHWQLTPSYVSGALDTLASVLAGVSSTATARAAPIYWSVGSTGSITTNSYLGRLGDTSATATSVSPVLIPCAGTVGDMRIQRTGNATATGTFQVFKASGGRAHLCREYRHVILLSECYDFAVMVSLTATVVGDEVVISVPGIVGKTINWVVTSGV